MGGTVSITAVKTVTRRIDATDSQGSVKEGVNLDGPGPRVIRVMYNYDEILKLKDINRSQVVHRHVSICHFVNCLCFQPLVHITIIHKQTNKQADQQNLVQRIMV